MSKKYYYELSNGDEILYCSVELPIKEETLPELINMPDYTARQITKEEYDKETK